MPKESKANTAIELKDVVDENQHLRIKLSVLEKQAEKLDEELKKEKIALKKEQQRLNNEQKKLFSVKTSTSFQVGQVIVRAFTKPGKNTLLAPYYLLRIILAN